MHKACMRTPDAAAYLGIPKSTLEKMRLSGDGPLYVKAGRIVSYRQSDIDRWLECQVGRSDGGALNA